MGILKYSIEGDLVDDFYLNLETGMFNHTFALAFYTAVPTDHCTFIAKDYFGNDTESAEDFYSDPALECDLRFGASGYPYNYFRAEINNHNVYFVRNTDQFNISFCDVKFVGEFGETRCLSGKCEVAL
ncbi:MAG: hypothetical protein ACI8ZM_003806 [Crocinitomix sp.]